MQINIQIVTTENLNDLLSRKLVEQGHNIVSKTSSYSEAFNKYKDSLPDILLVDIDITDTNSGIKFCRGIYNIDSDAHIIVLCEFLNTAIKSQLFEIGVEHWFEKPFQITNILAAIKSIESNYNLLQLRDKRNNLEFTDVTNDKFISKKEEFNSNVNSLREQIRLNRQHDDLNNTYNHFNNNSLDFDFTLDSSDEDIFKLDIEDTGMFFSQKEGIEYKENDYQTLEYKHSEKVNHETNGKRTYLGLPVFIDKNKINSENENTNNIEIQNNPSAGINISDDTNITNNKKELFGFIKNLRNK